MAKQNDNAKRVCQAADAIIAQSGEVCSLQIAFELSICPGEVYRHLCAGPYRKTRSLYWVAETCLTQCG
mgnify:CR=1 FL=1